MKWVALVSLLTVPVFAGTELTLEVRDAESNALIPARISMQVTGNLYPGDRIGNFSSEWPNIDAHGVFINGRKTFQLPVGKVAIAAAHGAEYHVARTNIVVAAGVPQQVVLKLVRFINLREQGWVCGDAHMHMIHGARKREVSWEDVGLTCNAGGLDWAYVNQGYVGAGKLDLVGYNAACASVSTDDFNLFIGGERPKSLLGHSAIIGVPDPFLVRDDPPYHIGAREVHRQGGILYYVHPIRYYPGKQWQGEWLDFPGNNMARELLFDMHLGPAFDALSVLSDEPNQGIAHQLWFNLLNRGYFVPLMADSDAVFDRPVLGKSAPGFWMSYVHVGKGNPVTHATLAEGIRKGRTFATTGPLLLVDIDGHLPGDTLPLDGAGRTLRIQGWHPHHHWSLEEGTHISKVELIRNGEVHQSWKPHQAHIDLKVPLRESEAAWYVVRMYGKDDRWQSAMCSPFYFASNARSVKQPVTMVKVKGRIYDFKNGFGRDGVVVVKRGDAELIRRTVEPTFELEMPLDATIEVEGAVKHDLLMGYGPIHRFLWQLESADLGKKETLDAFDALVKTVHLEFPIGYAMPGSLVKYTADQRINLQQIRLKTAPEATAEGGIHAATVLLDTIATCAGDTIHATAIFHWNGEGADVPDMELTIIGSGYDPSRPSGYNALKSFDSVEQQWSNATDLGKGYRMIHGTLNIPDWLKPGPMQAVEISVRARKGSDATGLIGLEVPIETTPRRALSVSSAWPTMPMSWHDHNYGIGPTRVCNKLGRKNRPRVDYRKMHLEVLTPQKGYDLNIPSITRGCKDSWDAVYTDQFFDQVLSEESGIGKP